MRNTMKLKLTYDEIRVLIFALNELRNNIIAENRNTDAVDEKSLNHMRWVILWGARILLRQRDHILVMSAESSSGDGMDSIVMWHGTHALYLTAKLNAVILSPDKRLNLRLLEMGQTGLRRWDNSRPESISQDWRISSSLTGMETEPRIM